MHPGALDQSITIERRTETADGGGGIVRGWEALATVWAAVKAKASREGMDEGRMAAVFAVMFTIRNRDVIETDRILWNGEVYNIRGVLRQGSRAMYVTIEAERGVAE